MAMLRNARGSMDCMLVIRRWAHAMAQSAPLDSAICHSVIARPLVLPESESNSDTSIGFAFPSFGLGDWSMELMAVPKKKVSPHKRGIRNGPKALKPVPVIIRCKVCGRVKLPHFFCCSGLRENTGENGPTS